jgi:hypothetical protein
MNLWYLLVALLVQTNGHIDQKGQALKSFYLSLHVDDLWLAGHHVNWETGEPDDPGATQSIKSHCSAFVAAACERLHYYIIRPPEHSQELLANAQYDWLNSNAGAAAGWRRLDAQGAYRQAQGLANEGKVVVAVVRNPDPHKPGHAALIMPDEKSEEALAADGPEVIMAGQENYVSTSLRNGFRHHLKAWPENVVVFYVMEH